MILRITKVMIRFGRLRSFTVWLATAMLLLALTSCTKSTLQAPTPEPVSSTRRCKRVAVLPFIDSAKTYGPNKSVWGPVTRQVFITDEIAPQGVLFMTRTLGRLLQAESGIQWIPIHERDLNHLQSSQSRPTIMRSLKRLGRQYKTDCILISYLYAFRNRRGGAVGVETPAYVAFENALVAAESGKLVWQRKFAEAQEPVINNLFKLGKFIQRKGRWVTAREMATQALKDILKTYPTPASTSQMD